MRMKITVSALAATLAFVAAGCLASAEQPDGKSQLVKDVYPKLTTGMMMEARLTTLPADILLKAGNVKITIKDLDAEIKKAPEPIRPQLLKDSFFILENRATGELLLAEATAWAKGKNQKVPTETSNLLKPYFDSLTAKASASDAELKDFYEKNKEMMGGAAFDQVKDELKQYLLEQKRQDALDAHIATIGKRTPIDINKAWVEKQYPSAMDNPVDKARLSGKPSLVDFGSDGCTPCEMMTPVLESLTKEYEGKMNVLFVHVRKEQILAARYGVQSIPVQVFFDKDGKEVFRHVGFFPKEQIVSKLSESETTGEAGGLKM